MASGNENESADPHAETENESEEEDSTDHVDTGATCYCCISKSSQTEV